MERPVIHHIPACPFSQRLEILLALKGRQGAVTFHVVDITRPRDPELLHKTRGTTALPVLETPGGQVIKESLVILRYLDETVGPRPVRRADPAEHAVENMLILREAGFAAAGYRLIMNRDRSAREALHAAMLAEFSALDHFLCDHSGAQDYLFNSFGLAETVFTPLFMRFWFLDYYEDFDLPPNQAFDRVRAWRSACLAHPAAGQVTREEIVKLYYDYAMGAGNGALVPGRARSSFAFSPHWRDRPWPPRDKYNTAATDAELGLT
ncbi:MAG TPA: glutathione S-transferase family protein [Devosiaceae bacterium]